MDADYMFPSANELRYKKALMRIIAIKGEWEKHSDGTSAWGAAYEIAREALAYEILISKGR